MDDSHKYLPCLGIPLIFSLLSLLLSIDTSLAKVLPIAAAGKTDYPRARDTRFNQLNFLKSHQPTCATVLDLSPHSQESAAVFG